MRTTGKWRSLIRNERPWVEIITEPADAERLCNELMGQPLVALDTEWYNYDKELGTPVNNGLCASLQFCWREDDDTLRLVFVYNHGRSSENVYKLRRYLESPTHAKILHNAPVDAHVIQNHGIKPAGMRTDTMVMDWLLDENRENKHGLKECAEDHLGRPRQSYNQTFGSPKLRNNGQPYASGQLIVPSMNEMLATIEAGGDEGDALFQKLVDYAADDAWDTWSLHEYFKPQLCEIPWVGDKHLYDWFSKDAGHITEIIQRMERRGMYLDLPFMAEMAEKCNRDLERYEAEALEWAGSPINLSSPPQLGHLFYGDGPKEIRKTPTSKKVLFTIHGRGFPILRRSESGAPSTRAEHLVELRRYLEKQGVDPEELTGFDAILKFKKYEKQRNTYLVGLAARARRSRVHGRVNQIGATSGRFSCVAEWTKLRTQRGLVPIRDVQPGDFAWTHRGRWRGVLRRFTKGYDDMFDLYLSNGEILTCTAEHKMLLSSGEWKTVGELIYGRGEQRLGQPRSSHEGRAPSHPLFAGEGQQSVVIEKAYYRGALEVFDVTVEEDASYEACGVISHNSSEPNLQNITTGDKDVYNIRDCFSAPPGHLLIVADFSQLEYRLLAHFSQDPKLIRMFKEGWDMHSLTAYNIFPFIQAEVNERFGGLCTEGLKWLAEEYPDDRKKAKCVHPDTLIRTETGYRTVGDVVGVGEDDTFTRPDSLFVQTPLGPLRLNSGYVGGEKELLVVVTRHSAIVCTPAHKLRLTTGEMVEAGSLRVGQELEEAELPSLPSETSSWMPVKLWDGVPETMQHCTADLAYFAGVFHGDGTNNESSASLTHGPVNVEMYRVWQEQLLSLCRGLGLAPKAKNTLVYLGSRVVVHWLECLGLTQKGGKRKHMSVPAWAMTQELFPSYFAGLADTDGCVGKDGRLSVTTKWPTYAGQLATLLRASGVQCSVDATFNKTYQRHYYRVSLAKGDGYRFMRGRLRLAHKAARLADGQQHAARANAITRIIEYGVSPCVDLNVKGHVYNANGLVTHNTLNFEIIYGVGAGKLADQLRITKEDAQAMIDGWFRGYAYVKMWMDRVKNEARSKGYGRTLWGRYRSPDMMRLLHHCQPGCKYRKKLEDGSSRRCGIQGEEERTFVNALIQGSAADMAQKAMINIDNCRELKDLGCILIMQVHDELIFEVPKQHARRAVDLIRPLMEQPFGKALRVEMPVSIGQSPTWASAKV